MKNHWLDEVKYKRLLREIDEIAMDTWGEDGTFGDFLNALNDDQVNLFMSMKLKDCAADIDVNELGITLMKP